SQCVGKIFIAPGNGIESENYTNVDFREDDLTGLLKFALENEISLTIPVSELALKSDIVSFFMSNGQSVFGPVKEACNIATNKAAGKKFLYKIHAQTSKFGVFDKPQMAEDWLKPANFPVTIKCFESNSIGDKLVCPTISLAGQFLENLFSRGEAGVLLEEYVFGHNFTVYFVTDGYSSLPFAVVGNYKFAEDGDGGLLSNGAGCYSPDYRVSQVVVQRVQNVVRNALVALEKKGEPYVGILGVECVITGEDKFYIHEFKPFLQDYDASSVLNLIDEDLIKLFTACIEGLFSDEYEQIKINNLSSVGAVVFSRSAGKFISGLEKVDDIENAGFINVRKGSDGKFVTGQNEVFVLTRTASTLNRAKDYLYDDLAQIDFDGMKYRHDICKG
ncbi:MAG: hypothetical protein K2F57_05790, partial [Candidatus Gastranaerophilales bacterium]|nr:hypothetical protein [Candidatus Gastranaerophilales bacterium]